MKAKTKIIVIDDHAFVRQAIKNFVEEENDLCVCAEAEGAMESLTLLEEFIPDLVIMDLSLKLGDGLSLTEIIRKRYPKLPILILTMHSDSLFAEKAIKAGANGYLMKSEASEQLIKAIRTILEGKAYRSDLGDRRRRPL